VNYTNYKSTIMVHFKSKKVTKYNISVVVWVHCATEVVCLDTQVCVLGIVSELLKKLCPTNLLAFYFVNCDCELVCFDFLVHHVLTCGWI
jgi:hypothetical protein